VIVNKCKIGEIREVSVVISREVQESTVQKVPGNQYVDIALTSFIS
jgi:hypothetical protein